MKVLWFSHLSSAYLPEKGGYNGGGWISSLLDEMRSNPKIQLGMAFFHPDDCFRTERDGISFYPMRRPASIVDRVDRFFRISRQTEAELALCRKVIDDFKPDVIHVFGTESSFGLLAPEVDVPVVIHLQGLLHPYFNAWLPPGYSRWDCYRRNGLTPVSIALSIRALAFNRIAARRELEILKRAHNFMGRTDWDRAYCRLFAPQARYFHCEETLRPVFLEPSKRIPPRRPILVSTISNPLYKGHDMILKTARVLADSGMCDFEWRVFGVSNLDFAARKAGICPQDVHVRAMGVAKPERLKEELLGCSLYVHPSYIDNSPNSVCEAQVLGVPVVATNVGGVSSLFLGDDRSGLVPANDPVSMADAIRMALSGNLVRDANPYRNRHDPKAIGERVLSIYKDIAARPR